MYVIQSFSGARSQFYFFIHLLTEFNSRHRLKSSKLVKGSVFDKLKSVWFCVNSLRVCAYYDFPSSAYSPDQLRRIPKGGFTVTGNVMGFLWIGPILFKLNLFTCVGVHGEVATLKVRFHCSGKSGAGMFFV